MAPNEPPLAQYATTGFIFDLSTILLSDRAGKPVLAQGAERVIANLQKHRIPFAIVTRNITMAEEEISRDLTERLGLPINPQTIILPHTPFRTFAPLYKDKPILVIGGEPARAVAASYGYSHILTPKDITTLYPHIYRTNPPTWFHTSTTPNGGSTTHPPWIPAHGGAPVRIAAVLVFWMTRDWARDMRVVTDVLLSQAGYVGTHSRANLAHLDGAPERQPRLYVSGAELTGRYGRCVPRRGGLDWLAALERRWSRLTGRALPVEVLCGLGCDKVTLGFADGVLDRANREANAGCCPFPGTVYAVGREIWFGAESDREEVRFDREARRRSIRVDPKRSGQMWSAYNFEAQTRPHHVSGSLKEAVEYALVKEERYCLKRGVEPLFSGALR